MDITLATRQEQGRSIVEVAGEVDVHTAPELDVAIFSLIAEGNFRVIVDLSGVEFLDSTGLGVLVKALKRVRETDGSLDVVASSDRITKVFRITGLDAVIGIHASVEDALVG
ncbi:MAG: STAS domain-containing protein [Actinobacteria bacterium]|nr:STAS domain-containing protein [Actinomycetota bacterium]